MIKCNYCGSDARYWTKHDDTIVCVCEKCKEGRCHKGMIVPIVLVVSLLCLTVLI